jgi:hypothetical protein
VAAAETINYVAYDGYTHKGHYDPHEHALFTPDFISSLAVQYATSRDHVTRIQHVSGPTLANATMALLALEKCAAQVRRMHPPYNHLDYGRPFNSFLSNYYTPQNEKM